jgi:hypothetical protein
LRSLAAIHSISSAAGMFLPAFLAALTARLRIEGHICRPEEALLDEAPGRLETDRQEGLRILADAGGHLGQDGRERLTAPAEREQMEDHGVELALESQSIAA